MTILVGPPLLVIMVAAILFLWSIAIAIVLEMWASLRWGP